MANQVPSIDSSVKTQKSGSEPLLLSQQKLATFSDQVFAELSEDLRPGTSSGQQQSQPQVLQLDCNLTANRGGSSARLGPAAALGAAMATGAVDSGAPQLAPDTLTDNSYETNDEAMMIVAKQISRLYRHMLAQLPRDVQIRTQQHLILRTAEVRSAGVPVHQAAMVVQQELLPLMHKAFVHIQSYSGLTPQKQTSSQPGPGVEPSSEPLAPIRTARIDALNDHQHQINLPTMPCAPPFILNMSDGLKNAGHTINGGAALDAPSIYGSVPLKRPRLGYPPNQGTPSLFASADGTSKLFRGTVLQTPGQDRASLSLPQLKDLTCKSNQSPTGQGEISGKSNFSNKEQVNSLVTTSNNGQEHYKNQNSVLAKQVMLNSSSAGVSGGLEDHDPK